jgi:hypothetical protein
MSHPGGRPADPVREAWALRFGLTEKQRFKFLTSEVCWQLSMCRSDEARRLLLGVSR